ncbi:MAG: bis(5'-nucleosyl)-tetraphosphatase (symmetrical) YqeK [Oscillospiraceae bacterium]|jgi:nicotinate-nucleotide adenylyltransferase|nr:bis(5'-nucleosyl)-tetraphosphatase (symmetrical) YqeK [Oscillospiraceae bacterium]
MSDDFNPNKKGRELLAFAQTALSEKRFVHSRNVASEAVRLADKYDCDKDKAFIAGILHDIRKEISPQEKLAEALKAVPPLDPVEKKEQKLWHGPAGAYFAKSALGIDDDDVLYAIRFHTIGRADMCLLEQIVYISDLISADRTYADVEKFRRYANESLDKTMRKALRFSRDDLKEKGKDLPLYTIEALQFYNA